MPQLSIWEKESFFAAQDIIIVGSGFVGLWSALQLINTNPKLKITIIERGIIPTGASTRNAGFSCFGSPSELLNDIAVMGEDKMWQLVEMRFKGLQEIRKHFTNTEMDYKGDGGYECFAADSTDWEMCNEKLNWLNEGLKKISGEENLYNIADNKIINLGFKDFTHLIESRAEAGLHPGKLVQALLKKVQSLGVQVLTGIEVKNYTEKENQLVVETNQQISFTTSQLLLCTNAFTKEILPDVDIKPCRGQVLLTSPVENLQLKGVFHFDRGYYYFRNLGNRILIGGARNKAFEEEDTNEMETTVLIQNELEHFIHQHILAAGSFTITDRWSGIMAMGKEKLPIVQQVSPGVFCCVRMSGMGVALAPIVSIQVAEMMRP